jgi:hypothetical protein
MFENALEEGSILLRLDSEVTKAVHRRGFLPVLRVAVAAWWNRPRIPPGLPDRLRADMGLPPAPRSMFWPEPDENWKLPIPIWRQ